MLPFPTLSESSFIKTRRQIHTVAKLIGKYREVLVKPIAKNDNLFLKVVPEGFCTPPIQEYNELEIGCSPAKLIIEIANSSGKYVSVNINGKTRIALNSEISGILNKDFGISADITLTKTESETELFIDWGGAEDFVTQLVNFHQILTDFNKKINTGVKTQICLWPDHFDNAFKWFSGKKINAQDEQMGIGVSNGDEMYGLPYIYTSLWPAVRKTNTLEIPEGAFLHDSEWTGMILPYEAIMEKNTTEFQTELINNFFDVSFASIQRAFSKR